MFTNRIMCSLLALILIILTCCESRYRGVKPPLAKNGITDLTNWDLIENGPVELNGEWKFMWMEDKPECAAIEYNDSPWDVLTLPGYWNEKTGSKDGFAWLRLKVINVKNKKLGLSVQTCHSAYKLYVNGENIIEVGTIGTDRTQEIPQLLPVTVDLSDHDSFILAWNVSNYHEQYGGPPRAPKIGLYKELVTDEWIRRSIDIFIIGMILMMCLYHFFLWFGRKQDTASLYFALFCFLLIIRTLVINHHITRLFPHVPLWGINNKINNIIIPLAWYCLRSFLFKLYPDEFVKSIYKILLTLNTAFSIIVLCTPPGIFLYFLPPYQVLLVIMCIWTIFVVVKALIHKKHGAGIILAGFSLLFLSIIYDIVKYHLPLPFIFSTHFGLVLFIFAQSIVLSSGFAHAFRTVEHLSSNLQQEVDKKTVTISNQNSKLIKLNEEKTAFFINLAHETKTPLTLITNYLDSYIKEKGEDPNLSVIKYNFEKIKTDMINFLDYEKIKMGRIIYYHNQIVNVSDLLNKKIPLFEETANKKNIKMTSSVEDEVYVKIDPYAIDRVFNNLFDNAIKYTDNEGEIYIQLNTDNTKLFFSIKDTGIGMSFNQQKYIFKPYYQISHKKRNVQGVGMGLTIVKNIINDIKGEIEVKSTLHKGTTIELIMHKYILSPDDSVQTNSIFHYSPRNSMDIDSHTNKTIKEFKTQYDHTKHTLLVIEDNKQMMMFLKKNMETSYNFYYAFNGAEALLQLAHIPRPDAIISDIMMDKMDGYEFYEELQKRKTYLSIPFIFLTAIKTQEEKVRALQKGAIDFISKPFSIDELLAKITSIIKVQQEMKELYIKEIREKYNNYINQMVLHKNISGRNKPEYDDQAFTITIRESEIIHYLTQGFLYKEIAFKLNISINTVREYIKRLYKKCGVQNKIELINFFRN